MADQRPQTTALQRAIEARMSDGEPFTFRELWLPHREGGAYREADRCIQRWRKRGWIVFHRQGRDTVWVLTDAGRRALAK